MYLPVCSPGMGCIYYRRPHLQPCGFKEWENGRWCCTWVKKPPSKSAHATGSNDCLTDIERLKIAFQADGSFSTGRSSSIRFSFSKPRKIERLRSILHKVGCTFKEYALKDGNVEFNIRLDASEFSKTFNWVDFENISSEWAKDFLQELSNWGTSVRSQSPRPKWRSLESKDNELG